MLDRKGAMVTTRKGFTLIEILVVIATIALLTAILFPVFARARENARRSSCQSNLKQVGLVFMQYAQDYDDVMPPAYNYAVAGDIHYNSWLNRMTAYSKSTQVFRCPSDRSNSRPNGGLFPGGASYHSSYGYNYNMSSPNVGNWATGNVLGIRFSAITHPTTTVLAADVGAIPDSSTPSSEWVVKPYAWILDDTTDTYVDDTGTSDIARAVSGPSARHLETSNVLWADGHVKAQRVESFYVAAANTNSPCLAINQTTTSCQPTTP